MIFKLISHVTTLFGLTFHLWLERQTQTLLGFAIWRLIFLSFFFFFLFLIGFWPIPGSLTEPKIVWRASNLKHGSASQAPFNWSLSHLLFAFRLLSLSLSSSFVRLIDFSHETLFTKVDNQCFSCLIQSFTCKSPSERQFAAFDMNRYHQVWTQPEKQSSTLSLHRRFRLFLPDESICTMSNE